MAERSSIYFYLDWTKQRIDEMDATLASLEAEARRMKADSKVKADQLIADLKKRRDEFQARAKGGLEAGYFDPPIDFAKEAEAAGAYGENVSDPAEVGPALKRGLPGPRLFRGRRAPEVLGVCHRAGGDRALYPEPGGDASREGCVAQRHRDGRHVRRGASVPVDCA